MGLLQRGMVGKYEWEVKGEKMVEQSVERPGKVSSTEKMEERGRQKQERNWWEQLKVREFQNG